MTQHLRSIYIIVHINGCLVRRALVDNGAALNILSYKMLKVLGKLTRI